MAASHVAGTLAASDVPLKAGSTGAVLAVRGSYEIATALEINSTVDLCHLPAGATILGGYLLGDDLDTGTEALEIDVGTRTKGTAYGHSSADPDNLLDSGVLSGDALADHSPGTGIKVHFNGVGVAVDAAALTVDTTVFATWTAAAAAGGTGTIGVVITYMMP